MLRPTSKAFSSTILIFSLPLPRSRSSSRFSRPFTRFSPLLSAVARSTSGLVSRKFDEASHRYIEAVDAHDLDRDDLERSEEHTSELQSLMRITYAVFCWKKKKKN